MHCGNQAVYFLTFRDLVPYEKETKSNINLYKGLVSLNPVCHCTEVLEAMQAQKEGRIKNGNVHTYICIYVYLKSHAAGHKNVSQIKATDDW